MVVTNLVAILENSSDGSEFVVVAAHADYRRAIVLGGEILREGDGAEGGLRCVLLVIVAWNSFEEGEEVSRIE